MGLRVLPLSRDSSDELRSIVWRGNPWVFPSMLARTVAVIAVAIVLFWLEFFFNVAYDLVLFMPVVLWTGLLLFIFWIFGILHLLLVRASHVYILRKDSLEVRSGILTSKSYVVTPSGFSDLEVTRTISGRIMDFGDILIHTQGESELKMQRVRQPLKVSDQIREVMARPIVRIGE